MTKAGSLEQARWDPSDPLGVANQNAEFASLCPLADSSIYQYTSLTGVTSKRLDIGPTKFYLAFFSNTETKSGSRIYGQNRTFSLALPTREISTWKHGPVVVVMSQMCPLDNAGIFPNTYPLDIRHLWSCAGDWVEMVVKVHCGTLLRDEFPAMLKMRPSKQSHNALGQPISRATSKSRIVLNVSHLHPLTHGGTEKKLSAPPPPPKG